MIHITDRELASSALALFLYASVCLGWLIGDHLRKRPQNRPIELATLSFFFISGLMSLHLLFK